MRAKFVLSLVVLFISSCSNPLKDATNASKEYCDCFKGNLGKLGFEATQKKCDSQIVNNYYLYKVYYEHVLGTTFKETTPSLDDSVRKFISIFHSEVDKSCPGFFYK